MHEQKKPCRRKWEAASLFLFLFIVVFSGCGKNNNTDTQAGGNQSPNAGLEKTVEFAIEAFGEVRAPVQMLITVDFPVTVETIHAERGELLKKGEKIITLDLREYRYELESLRASHRVEKLRLEKLRQELDREDRSVEQEYARLSNQIEITEAELKNLKKRKSERKQLLEEERDPEIQQMKNDMTKKRSDYTKALKDLEESRVLFQEGAISEQEFDRSASAVEDLESQMIGLEYQLEQLFLSRDEELENIELQIRQKETSVKNLLIEREKLASPGLAERSIQEMEIRRIERQIENHLEKSRKVWFRDSSIVNPYDSGLLGTVSVTEGEKVLAGTECVIIIDNSTIEVEGYIPEEFIKDIKTGDPVVVRPVADPEREYPGTVVAVSAMAIERNNETVVPVTVSVVNHDSFLLPNFNVDITFNPPEEKDNLGEGKS